MRNWTTSCGLVLGLIATSLIVMQSARANDVRQKVSQIKGRAAVVFNSLDQNNDGVLAGREQELVATRVQREIRVLTTANGIGGVQPLSAAAVQVRFADRDRVTLPEFTDAFLAEAVRHDGEIRALRMARASAKSAPVAIAAVPVYYGNGPGRSKQDHDRFDNGKYDRHRIPMAVFPSGIYGPIMQSPVLNYGPAMGGQHGGGESHHAGNQGWASHHGKDSGGEGHHHHGK